MGGTQWKALSELSRMCPKTFFHESLVRLESKYTLPSTGLQFSAVELLPLLWKEINRRELFVQKAKRIKYFNKICISIILFFILGVCSYIYIYIYIYIYVCVCVYIYIYIYIYIYNYVCIYTYYLLINLSISYAFASLTYLYYMSLQQQRFKFKFDILLYWLSTIARDLFWLFIWPIDDKPNIYMIKMMHFFK